MDVLDVPKYEPSLCFCFLCCPLWQSPCELRSSLSQFFVFQMFVSDVIAEVRIAFM
jgi:hypothetical protein